MAAALTPKADPFTFSHTYLFGLCQILQHNMPINTHWPFVQISKALQIIETTVSRTGCWTKRCRPAFNQTVFAKSQENNTWVWVSTPLWHQGHGSSLLTCLNDGTWTVGKQPLQTRQRKLSTLRGILSDHKRFHLPLLVICAWNSTYPFLSLLSPLETLPSASASPSLFTYRTLFSS